LLILPRILLFNLTITTLYQCCVGGTKYYIHNLKMNKIFCVGLGKLGLIFSQILASHDNIIYGYDTNKDIRIKIKNNTKDKEPYLNSLIKKNKKKFFFIDSFSKAVSLTNSCFVIVPTPSKKNHEFDNSYIFDALNKIGQYLHNKKNYLINITSTVNPGTCNYLIEYLEKKFNLKHGKEFILTYNPHLIALGSIYHNVINSDVVIAGSDLPSGHNFLKKIYLKIYKKNINKLKFLNLKEAEISKIAINTYVTLKISYTNCLSQIADKEKNIDVSKILNAIGYDKRIGHKYLSLGALYAGPCFPRDNRNFAKYLKKIKVFNQIPITIDKVNNIQIHRYIHAYNKLKRNVKNKITIGICGLSYKINTSLTTESPGEKLLKYFKNKNKVIIHDEQYPLINSKIYFYKNIKKFFNQADVIFICYQNSKFKKIEKFKSKKTKIIIDLWNYINIKNKNILLKTIGVN
jgi:UDPglucose 6-dehydrogenase